MCAAWQHSAIVSVIFSQGGIIVGKLRRVELARMGEDLPWLIELSDVDCGDLMHMLKFADVSQNLAGGFSHTRHNLSCHQYL